MWLIWASCSGVNGVASSSSILLEQRGLVENRPRTARGTRSRSGYISRRTATATAQQGMLTHSAHEVTRLRTRGPPRACAACMQYAHAHAHIQARLPPRRGGQPAPARRPAGVIGNLAPQGIWHPHARFPRVFGTPPREFGTPFLNRENSTPMQYYLGKIAPPPYIIAKYIAALAPP